MEQSTFFVTPPSLQSGRNAVRLRLFLLRKLEILGRINIEKLENTGKEQRAKEKKDNRFNQQQMQMSSATLSCAFCK